METRICTWNVNGIRSRRNLCDVFKDVAADVFCIQETKIQKEQVDESLAFVNNRYESCFAIPKQIGFKGRSGCATYYVESARPNHIELGLLDEETCSDDWKSHCLTLSDTNSLDDLRLLDSEGRVIVTSHQFQFTNESTDNADDLHTLHILNIYFPRLDSERADRLEFKDKFNKFVEEKVNFLLRDPLAHVIIGCDLNIVHKKIDSCEPADKFDECIFRIWLSQFLAPKEGCADRHMVDSFRVLHPGIKYAYTCWETKILGSRQNNYGCRLDLIMVDSSLVEYIAKVEHLTNVYGSDHCPVLLTLKNIKFIMSKEQPLGSTRTWYEFRKRQTSLKSFFTVIPRTRPQAGEKESAKSKTTDNGKEKRYTIRDKKTPTKTNKSSSKTSQSKSPAQRRLTKKKGAEIKRLTAYEIIMQPKTNRLSNQRPIHCPNHGVICEPKLNLRKGSNEGRSFLACSAPNCSYFRWINA